MTSPKIQSIRGTILIRFDRPEVRNPLSVDVLESVTNTINEIDLQTVDRVVFTGSGDSFASGADLREIGSLTADQARGFAERGQMLMNKIEDLPVLTIAAINGYCFGGGLDLALSCKARLASPNAVFCHPGVNLGIITGWGGTQRMPRLIGEGPALELLLTASQISASEAHRIGLIDRVTEDAVNAALNYQILDS